MYDLSSFRVRLDTTRARTYQAPTLNGLFQKGPRSDHRPDLAQVKIMLRRKDPLGWERTTEVVDGSFASDPLYEPVIEKVRATLNCSGVLYVGDTKMAATQTVANVANNKDCYLVPLPVTQVPQEVLVTILEPVMDGSQHLTEVYRELPNGSSKKIAEGYEFTETRTVEINEQISNEG